MDPDVALAVNHGLSARELRELQELIEERKEEIREHWRKHFKR